MRNLFLNAGEKFEVEVGVVEQRRFCGLDECRNMWSDSMEVGY